jgi:hypothetical protein
MVWFGLLAEGFKKSPSTKAARAIPTITISNPECFLICPITAILMHFFKSGCKNTIDNLTGKFFLV